MLEYLDIPIAREYQGSDFRTGLASSEAAGRSVTCASQRNIVEMASSPVHSSGQAAILKHTKIMLNTTFTTAPVMPSLNENLLQRDVFDYDFNRERIFLEIAEAEIAAMRKAEDEEKAAAASEKDDSDDELARQSAKLSLSSSMSSTGYQDGTPTKPRSSSEEDVAAAISASLREY